MEPDEQGVRLKRQDPLRIEPIRNWSTVFKKSQPENAETRADGARARAETARGGPVDPVVAHGVALGYQVVEDHIRQGRRVAEQLGSTAAEAQRSTSGEVRDLAEKVLRLYGELGSQVVRVIETVVGNSDFLRDALAGREPRESGPGPGSSANTARGGQSAHLEVSAGAPVRVKVELKPLVRPLLAVQPLRSMSGEQTLIGDISVTVDGVDGVPVVRLRVPQNQPPGLYTGVVLDQSTGDVAGTVSVIVSEPEGES